jgi:hypothetical protein
VPQPTKLPRVPIILIITTLNLLDCPIRSKIRTVGIAIFVIIDLQIIFI